MPFKIVRNDITKMETEAIVNTANEQPVVGTGCDHAVYMAAGYDQLLAWRRDHIGWVKEGDAFITPGFNLAAKYIIHAVSPLYVDGKHEEEELLRSCYRKSLTLAAEKGIGSLAFPLISTGGFGYPKEEGMRIAVDEIHAFLLHENMDIFLVVFDEKATRMGRNLFPDLDAYIDRNYVEMRNEQEYGEARLSDLIDEESEDRGRPSLLSNRARARRRQPEDLEKEDTVLHGVCAEEALADEALTDEAFTDETAAIEEMEQKLEDRMAHMSDTFPQYLLYLIREKGMKNTEVYKRAIVDKKVFSKIKTNPAYHPQKLTALCLCVGARLNMDETRDLLARAGYALSPCDKTDIIFSYFIENGIYDMIELDIQLEEHGLPCIIT